MRKTDSVYQPDPEAVAMARARIIRTVAGLLIAVAGCAVAILRPEHMLPGFLVALVGAGIVDPSLLLSKVL